MKKQMTEAELTALIKQLNMEQLEQSDSSSGGWVTDHSTLEQGDFNEQDGWIQVKDHRIIVKNPIAMGEYPMICPVAPLKLYVNNLEVFSDTIVSEGDAITWEMDEISLFDIRISEDKMFAYFQLHSKHRYAWRLTNQERSLRMELTAEEDRTMILETVHLADVISKLELMSVNSNLDFAAIQQELMLPSHQPVIAAKGKESIPGKDAELELYFAQQVESQFFETEGTIDFRNHLRIPTVNKGDIMARKIPMEYGIPGFDVQGNIAMPVPPKDIQMVVKPNVILQDGAVIANKHGRPRITGGKIKTFDVSTSFIVSGNVDISTGNIVFSGDVIIYGDVQDNMIIESLGNVYVFGSVYNSTITATGSINVRGNLMASRLYSGYFGVLFNRLYNISMMLYSHIDKLLTASRLLAQALEAKKQEVRYGQIILLLLENKMTEIYGAIKDLLVVVSNIQHLKKEDYDKLRAVSEIFLQPTKLLEVASYSFIQSFLNLLQDTHQEVARMQEEKVEISISQCHKSELKSNGDIMIHRDGVLLSDLYSAKNIIFLNDNSVCRGSKLDAGGSISAKIIGSQTGAISVLKAKKKVKVRKIYSGRICVGRLCRDIHDVVENMDFDSLSLRK